MFRVRVSLITPKRVRQILNKATQVLVHFFPSLLLSSLDMRDRNFFLIPLLDSLRYTVALLEPDLSRGRGWDSEPYTPNLWTANKKNNDAMYLLISFRKSTSHKIVNMIV